MVRRLSGRCFSIRRSARVDSLIGSPIAWFAHYPLLTIIVIDAWKTMPFVMFLIYAGIMSIEPLQFEAAKIDGANRAGIPAPDAAGILPVVVITTAFRAVDAFTKAFDIILATTAGGPGHARWYSLSTSGALRSSACISARHRRSLSSRSSSPEPSARASSP